MHRLALMLAGLTVAGVLTCGGGTALAAHPHQSTPDGTPLKLSDAVFAPGTLNAQYVGTASNDIADQGYFASFHGASYASFSRLTGFYELADWQPTQGDPVTFQYQGSIYASANQASASWNDANTATASIVTMPTVSCQDQFSVPCDVFQVAYQGDTIRFYNVQVGACTAEIASETTAGTDAAQPQIQTTLSAIVQGAVQLMQATCVQTALSIQNVTVHTKNSENSPAVTKVKAGKKGYVFVDWQITSNGTPTGTNPTYAVTAKLHGKKTAHVSFAGTLDNYVPDQYYFGVSLVLRHTGTYALSATVTYNGQKKTTHTKLKVVK